MLNRIFSILLLSTVSGFGLVAQELVVTDMAELERQQKLEPRPVLLFLTAEWCTYCRRVEQTAFKDKKLIDELNTSFYTVLFDIEHREQISWMSQVYRYKPSGVNTGVHSLAEHLGTIDGVLNTPTFIMMDGDLNILYRYGGFMDTEQVYAMLMQTKNYIDSYFSSGRRR